MNLGAQLRRSRFQRFSENFRTCLQLIRAGPEPCRSPDLRPEEYVGVRHGDAERRGGVQATLGATFERRLENRCSLQPQPGYTT